jgi:hypothetical protein
MHPAITAHGWAALDYISNRRVRAIDFYLACEPSAKAADCRAFARRFPAGWKSRGLESPLAAARLSVAMHNYHPQNQERALNLSILIVSGPGEFPRVESN